MISFAIIIALLSGSAIFYYKANYLLHKRKLLRIILNMQISYYDKKALTKSDFYDKIIMYIYEQD